MSLTQKLGALAAFALLSTSFYLGVYSHDSISTMEESNETSLAGLQNKTENMLDKNSSKAMQLKAQLEQKLPGIEISDIEISPINGFYQAFYSGQLLYVSEDGKFIFTGNLLELAEQQPINHSQQAITNFATKNAPMRAKAIAAIDESDMVIFRAKEEKYVVTVFTDVDCGYCRKLHKEMKDYNKKGITVRYLAYPRAGIGSEAYQKLVSVWCADDPISAMDDAKLRRKFTSKSCNNPINKHYDLTRKFNLSGTPAIILDDGELIGGYVPAGKLSTHLVEKAKLSPSASVEANSAK
ncbi:thioredoxin fold domain-containing protein [Aliikangiella sp. IMCC44359]|uniref:thioredoxin fold domain-containing protein n=1 Tax=Aliikangiella sp. IMCC44359 TaxID=3459125 RepID=UPI00403AB7D9